MSSCCFMYLLLLGVSTCWSRLAVLRHTGVACCCAMLCCGVIPFSNIVIWRVQLLRMFEPYAWPAASCFSLCWRGRTRARVCCRVWLGSSWCCCTFNSQHGLSRHHWQCGAVLPMVPVSLLWCVVIAHHDRQPVGRSSCGSVGTCRSLVV